MNESLFRFPSAVQRHAGVELWLDQQRGELGNLARLWFDFIRHCGDDIRELVHDGRPTACVGDAAFAYVDRFKAHVSVGFFCGFALNDPGRLLEGTGKRMRHVKLRVEQEINAEPLSALIQAAYFDMKQRLSG